MGWGSCRWVVMMMREKKFGGFGMGEAMMAKGRAVALGDVLVGWVMGREQHSNRVAKPIE